MPVMEACWSAEEADAVLNTEALRTQRAVFLAVHTPVEEFSVHGSQASDLEAHTEQELLSVLSRPGRQHAFCVVRGEPGSGKSHLIKWLRVQWPQGNDVVLLIRRADGSLEGSLRQLKEELGDEFATLFDQIEQRSRASYEGRVQSFLTQLGTTLAPNYFDPPLDDQQWCATYRPGDLFSRPTIRDRWKGPERVLNLIEGRGAGLDAARNSQSAAFDLFDIVDLVAAGNNDVLRKGVRHGTETLWKALVEEAGPIRSHRDKGWTSAELIAERPVEIRHAREFADALNRRRNEAIRYALGVSSDALKKLFKDVRVLLQEQNRRLVLLLEDITSFEGIDDSLIDVLVDDAGTQDEDVSAPLCPLISVVGVTPAYYQHLQGNYRQRITHDIALGEDHGALQDVALLRASETREQFVARYLNAVRAGRARLKEWEQEGEGKDRNSPPNICSSCRHQPTCFETFGDLDGRGLFPLTRPALHQLYDALKENDQGQTWRTPRGIIQAILSPVLRNPAQIASGQFPHPAIESTSLSEDRLSTQAASHELLRVVGHRVADEGEQARMLRLIAFWGQPNRTSTVTVDGELAFAGVKRSIFAAFDLPWIGDESADAEIIRPPTPEPEAPERPEDSSPPDNSQDQADSQATHRPARPAPKPEPDQPPSKRKQTRSDFQKLRADLSKWRDGSATEQGTRWNEFLFDILSSSDLRRFGVSPGLRDRVLTSNRIKLFSSTGGEKDRFVVPREGWVVDGLEALLNLRLGAADEMAPQELQSRLASLAKFTARLEEDAARFVIDRTPRLREGSLWSPAAALAQILFAREVLRGTITTGASIAESLSVMLGGERDPVSAPKSRSAPWHDFLLSTDRSHDNLRTQLQSLLNLETEPGKISGMIDTSEIAASLMHMRKVFLFEEAPKDVFAFGDHIERAREIVSESARQIASLSRVEAKMLSERADTILSALEGNSIDGYLRRVTGCVDQVSANLPHAAPEKILAWRMLLQTNTPATDKGAALQDLLISLKDEEALPTQPLALVQWLAAQPADDLERLWELCKSSDALIHELTVHVEARIEEAGNSPDIGIITETASALRDVEAAGSRVLEGRRDE